MKRIPRQPRQGAAIILVIVLIMVVSAMAVALLKTAMLGHQQARDAQRQMQAAWLAEAGLQRAAAQLRRQADYTGEEWEIEPAELATDAVRPAGARVRIEVHETERAGRQRLGVQVEYPADSPRGVHVRKQLLIDVDTEQDQP